MRSRLVLAISAFSLLVTACSSGSSAPPSPPVAPPPPPPVNTVPVAQDLSMRVATSLPAAGTLAGSDADGDTLTYVIATQPANGTIQNFDAATGAFTYNAAANFEGVDSFTYQTNDGFADSQAATFSLSVNEWLGTVSFGTAVDEDAIYGLAIDDQMNLFAAYETGGEVPGATSAGGSDVALAMVDKAGTVLWQTQWGTTDDDTAYIMIRAADGSLYLGSDSFLNGVATSQHIVKFDADGNLLWELQLPEPSTRTQLYRMALAPNGNLYVNAYDFPRSQLMKITPGGTLVWTKVLGTSADDPLDPLLIGTYDDYWVQVRDFVVDANEIIYMALNLEYTENGQPHTPYTSMLASFNSDGTILSRLQPFETTAWSPLGDPARLLDMQWTGAGNLRVAGYTELGDFAVAETDTAGSEIWSTTRSVVDEIRLGFSGWIDANGNTLVTGRADSTINPDVNREIFLAKYSDAGVFLWESILSGMRPDGSTDVDDHGGQPVTDADGSVFMLVASDGGAIGSGTNQGGLDVFLVKLDGDTGAMIHP